MRRIFLRRKDKTGLPLIPNGLRLFTRYIQPFLFAKSLI